VYTATGAGVSSLDVGAGFRHADAAMDEWSISVAFGSMPGLGDRRIEGGTTVWWTIAAAVVQSFTMPGLAGMIPRLELTTILANPTAVTSVVSYESGTRRCCIASPRFRVLRLRPFIIRFQSASRYLAVGPLRSTTLWLMALVSRLA
jgi:hypothetical protein